MLETLYYIIISALSNLSKKFYNEEKYFIFSHKFTIMIFSIFFVLIQVSFCYKFSSFWRIVFNNFDGVGLLMMNFPSLCLFDNTILPSF